MERYDTDMSNTASKSRFRKYFSTALLVCAAMLVAGGGWFWWMNAQPQPIPQHLLKTGGDFILQSFDGPVSLADYRGEVVLIYFGYTNCSDACPVTLSNWARAFKRLEDGDRQRVNGMLVSVDPGRDTPELLKDYATYFDARIVGVTGSDAELADVTLQYRADYVYDPPEEDGSYHVNHTSFVYVVGPDGKVRSLLNHDSRPDEIIYSVKDALKVRG